MPALSTAAEEALAVAREGATCHQQGDLAGAEVHYRKALAIDPDQRNALNNLALIELTRSHRVQALELLRRLAAAHPDFALGLNTLGTVLLEDGRIDEGLPLFERAATLQPTLAEASNNQGIALSRLGRREEALAAFDRAIAARTSYAEAHANRGNLLREMGRLADAEAALKRALTLAPLLAAAHSGLGCLLKERGEFDAAMGSCRRAVDLSPGAAEFWKNLSLVSRKAGQLPTAVAAARRAIAIAPSYADAHFDLAQALLLAGDYAGGWPEYEWRWRVAHTTPNRDFRFPSWQGEPLAGKSILVWPEQGPGDIVMFAGCLRELVRTGAAVTLIAPARLFTLLRRSFPSVAVLQDESQGIRTPYAGPFDYAAPIGSLPLHFRRDEKQFAGPARYLTPDAGRVAAWRRKFESLGPGLRIGISWRAGNAAGDARFRQTVLPDWLSLFTSPGYTFISLQYQPDSDELRTFGQTHGVHIHSGPDAAGDMDDFAAACDALDAVVAIAGTPVHFSGALGKPTWTVAPFAPDWRWQLGRADCPWYPTMRLVRQGLGEPWADVMARTAAAFLAWAEDKQGT